MLGTTADINDYIKTTDINPPLWKVTDPESGNSLYLLGTMHILPEAAKDYPEKVMDIYKNCDAIAVEYDTVSLMSDASAFAAFQNGFVYKDGSKITDHISDETYIFVRLSLSAKTRALSRSITDCASPFVPSPSL